MTKEISTEVSDIISAEESVLKQVMNELHLQLSRGKDRLKMETARARDLNNRIVAATRSEDKAMLASDEAVSYGLSNLKRSEVTGLGELLDQPYFARIVLAEKQPDGTDKNIEYKLGLQSNIDCRIIDWRKAPISKLYYEYKEGDEYVEEIQGRTRIGRVLLRHKVEVKGGELQRISCRYGDFVRRPDGWQKVGEGSRTREATGYRQLPNILSLITAEQFRMITEDADSAIIIQGVAGSGKTTVALHRLAWLLHEDNSDLKPQECLVLVKSKALRTYIVQSLETLGLRNVPVITLTDWAMHSHTRIEQEEKLGGESDSGNETAGNTTTATRVDLLRPVPGVARLKRSLALLKAVEAYDDEQRLRVIKHLEQKLNWTAFPPHVPGFFQRLPESKIRTQLIGSIRLVDELIKELRGHQSDPAFASEIASAIEYLEYARRRLSLYREDLLCVLRQPAMILALDETGLLDKEIIESARIQSEEQRAHGVTDPDDEPLLLRLFQRKNNGIITASRDIGSYRSIVVDEVQDFSPPELASVIGAVDDVTHLTLVGDTAQEVGTEATFPGWDKLRKHWDLGDNLSRFVTLSVSHRSTLPIMRLADHILGTSRTTAGRPGRAPLWFKCNNEGQATSEGLGWLMRVSTKYPGGLTLVVCRDLGEARYVESILKPTFGPAVRIGDEENFSFDEGIIVSTVALVKGLEFQNVLLWNPSKASYPANERSQKLLYTAITRAEENLCIVTAGVQTPLLPPIRSPLVRGIESEPSEERSALS